MDSYLGQTNFWKFWFDSLSFIAFRLDVWNHLIA